MTQTPVALTLAGLSFMVTIIWGAPLLRVLRHFKVGKTIRVEGPQRHFTKMGTPTMGGVLVVLPVLLITVLLNATSLVGFTLSGRSALLPLSVLVSYAILGAIDDWEGIRGKRPGEGMRGGRRGCGHCHRPSSRHGRAQGCRRCARRRRAPGASWSA